MSGFLMRLSCFSLETELSLIVEQVDVKIIAGRFGGCDKMNVHYGTIERFNSLNFMNCCSHCIRYTDMLGTKTCILVCLSASDS